MYIYIYTYIYYLETRQDKKFTFFVRVFTLEY